MADYQGWKNFETFTLALFFTSESKNEAPKNELIDVSIGTGPHLDAVTAGTWTAEQGILFTLADGLKAWAEDMNERAGLQLQDRLFPGAALFGQLLTGALENVDFQEIAEDLLETRRNG